MKKSFFSLAAIGMLAASCQKQSPAIDAGLNESNIHKTTAGYTTGLGGIYLTQKGFRKLSSNPKEGCINVEENCHPEDIIITKPKLLAFDAAITSGSGAIVNYFNNASNATAIIPQWNADYFTPVKTEILSGQYNFKKLSTSGKTIYFLGKDGQVSETNYEYVLAYEVQ